MKHRRECVFRADKVDLYRETTKALAREFSRRSFKKGGITKTRNKPNSSCDMCQQFNTGRCIATFAEDIRKGIRAKLSITQINDTLGFENQSDGEDQEDEDDPEEVASIQARFATLETLIRAQDSNFTRNFKTFQDNLTIILRSAATDSPLARKLKPFTSLADFEVKQEEEEGDGDTSLSESEEDGDVVVEDEEESSRQHRRNGIISDSDEVFKDDEMDVQLS